ncbi:type II toxin-antitoxin system VapC family toxin [Propionimicrobium sp. PCR01-08-3]|uniref:PIN domain-containing protein n=1 Tax=Propionimicrobium sp. PCR01-08-3 TaxID=3052086 RepID=UPI00255C8F63|nr:type II toxin-antitoxin system VapC family toxin [Propionimicrobium sp. PCR01-08-3]WIY82516.1 type II toxin-antitoxin system VapC family toxin [Propionimicrobium sp. PCR01-08-3]
MIGLDTNIVVRFLTQDDAAQAQRATAVFERLTEIRPGFIATVVWAEVYWVLTRAYGFARLDVVAQLSELSMADEIRAEDPSSVASAIAAAGKGADFPDALIASVAARAGCDEVVTFDRRASAKLGWRLLT